MATSLNDIKTRHSIIDIATALGLEPKTRAGKATCNCPVCQDETGHLYLYPDSNRFHCFKCQSSGDLIDLWQRSKNQQPKEAIAEIKRLYAYDSPALQQKPLKQPEKAVKIEMAETVLNPERLTEVFMQLYLLTRGISPTGKQYLNARGISDALVTRYDITSIDNPNEMKKKLLDNFDLETLITAGLFDYSTNGKPYFVFFQPAILFPHFSHDGKQITSMSTRNLAGDTKSFKLHNQPTRIYFGQIEQSKELYIFEGIINALSYAEITGRDNFLALCGLITPKAFEALQIRFPNRKLVLGLDPDAAGKAALAEIGKCTFINYEKLSKELGFSGLPAHPNGKPFDLNDLLVKYKEINK